MNCLGYALLHPLQLERTLNGSELTLAFDDGVDIVLAAAGAGGIGPLVESYATAFNTQLDQVTGQFEALGAAGGPFADVAALGDLLDGPVDVLAGVERVADFLCDLQPTVAQGMLGGLVERFAGALPVLDPAELGSRVRTLATAGLAVFEGRLLAGDTDLAAHRGYRAGAAIRLRLDPLLERLEDVIRAVDVVGSVREALDDVPPIDDQVVTRLREGGCLLRDQVVPLVRCASTFGATAGVSVSAGGPQGQDGDAAVPLSDDALPAPHPVGHWLWILDLVTNAVALGSVIYDSVRTQNPPERFTQLIFTDILRPIWVFFRGLARAFRWPFINGPPGDSDADRRAQRFVRFLFSDFGDFFVQFVLELFGSIHDMIVGWSNWISSIGLRLVKYYTYVVQPRTVYLFFRSADWVRRWSKSPARVVLDESARAAARLDPANAAAEPLTVVAGGETSTVTFSGAQSTPEAIAAHITAEATGVVARVVDGNLIIETEATGRPASLTLTKGAATFPSTARPKIPMVRYAWLVYGPAAVACFIAGIVYGRALWAQFHIQSVAMLAPVLAGLVFIAASIGFMPYIQADGYDFIGWNDVETSQWMAVFALGAAVVVLLIAMLTLVESAPNIGVTLGAIFGPLLFAGFAVGAAVDADFATGIFYVLVWITGLMMSGVLTSIVWWFALADGSDRNGVFAPLTVATSPYRLPYPSGDVWLCGQNSHGFFSHQLFNGDLTSRNVGNHFSYDLNEAHGSTVLAARTGLVCRILDHIPDGNRATANRVQVQHLDWVAGHDPGWDLERGITYTDYLHLANNRAHVQVNQLVRQGYHIADSDDTGISAMNHLHFSANSGQNMSNATILPSGPGFVARSGLANLPAVFREGHPKSLVFYRSTNERVSDGNVSAVDMTFALVSAGATPHTHNVALGHADLAADGTIPANVTLVSDVGTAGPRHRHRLALTRAQVQAVLRNADPATPPLTSTTVDGHAHAMAAMPVRAAAGTLANALGLTAGTVTPALATPPGATLLARDAASPDGDYNLLGRQMVLRVNGRVTEWHSFGSHRARAVGSLTLDRGPGNGAAVSVQVNTGAAVPVAAGQDLMARAAAAAMAPANVVIRTEPVIVIETRMRGSDARLQLTASPANLPRLTTGLARGSGTVPRLDSVTPARLRTLVNDALTQQASPGANATLAGASLTLAVGGAAVTAFAGSTGRIDEVMSAFLLGGGTIAGVDPLPLTTGSLVLDTGADQFTVPVAAAHARVVLDGPAQANLGLDPANVAGPMTIQVRDDVQTVRFVAADNTPQAVANRINAEAEGVRASADAAGRLFVETVAAGTAARLTLVKGGVTATGVVVGTAPALAGGVRIEDSTAVTLAQLEALVDHAEAEATRASAPAAAAISGGVFGVTANPAADVTLTGPQVLMGVLNVPPDAANPGLATVTGNPTASLGNLPATMDLLSPGWIDVSVGGGAPHRVDVTAEPARVELAANAVPRAGEDLRLTVNGTPVVVAFQAEHVTSLPAVAARIQEVVAATPGTDLGVTTRLAYRYSFESARHGGDDLTVGAAPSPGNASAGIVGIIRDTGRSQVADATAAARQVIAATGPPPPVPPVGPVLGVAGPAAPFNPVAAVGRPVRAYDAQGSPITFTASGGGDVAITAADAVGGVDVDPLGLVGTPAPTLGGGPFVLGRESVGYQVAASGATVDVELNAAPAHLHSLQSLPFDPLRFGAGAAPLVVTVTDPAGAATTATVDLAGAATAAAAASRIQRDAPHVRCWAADGRTNIETRGGGTAWQLRLEGEAALLGLGFDPAAIDGAGGIDASGDGNVEDGAEVTLDEVRDVFHTMGGLATVLATAEYVAAVSGANCQVTSPQGAVTFASDPPSLAAALATTPVAGGVDITAPVALDVGWLFVQVGGRHAGSGAVWGRRAAVEAPNPLPADLTTVGATTLQLLVDGGPALTTNLPAGAFADQDALLSRLNRSLAPAGASISVVRRGGSDHLRIESHSRGTASAVEWRSFPPALGFTAIFTRSTDAGQVAGGGTAANLAAVTAPELRTLLNGGLGFANTPQEAVEADDPANQLRLVASGGTTVVLTSVTDPHGLTAPAAPPRQDVITYPFAAPLDTGPHLTVLQVQEATLPTVFTRRVQALLRAEPARLGAMTIPTPPSALDGTALRLTAGGIASTVTFAGVTSTADVAAQIVGGTGHRVRAIVAGSTLRLESMVEGTSGALSVDTSPGVSTALAQLGTPAPASATGAGNVTDRAAVTAAEYEAIVDDGFLGPDTPGDQAAVATVPIGLRRPILPGDGGPGAHLQAQSGRIGCDSALEILPADPGTSRFGQQLAGGIVDFDRSLGRGPAVRASVALPPFVDAGGAPATRNLNGDLWIRLNDNGDGTDLAPPTDVEVSFNGAVTAQQAAETIHAALLAAGAGAAAAYPDETVVIETATPGLSGSVTVPSPGPASTPAVLTALGISGSLTNRGWPGAGDPAGRIGFRSHTGNALAAEDWQFAIQRGGAVVTSTTVNVTANQAPAAVAAAIDAALRDPTGAAAGSGANRIGIAALGDDGAINVELFQAPATAGALVPFQFGPPGGALAAPPPDAPPNFEIWIGGDVGVAPACELRRTDVLRTIRLVYFDRRADDGIFIDPSLFDPNPAPDPGTLDQRVFDVGWVRPPTNPAGAVQGFQRFMLGRWLVAARAEGARSDSGALGNRTKAYGPDAEMIRSGGTATIDGRTAHFPTQVRYWVTISPPAPAGASREAAVPPATSSPVRLARIGDEFFVDFVVL